MASEYGPAGRPAGCIVRAQTSGGDKSLDKAITLSAEIADKALVRSFSYIGGKWCAAGSGETVAVHDPATGDRLGDVASLSAEESAAAVDAAQAAFAGWSMTLPQE
ncbi:MAG: aldehyde dehydrogenase family protein, partial [Roseovarius sp.]|nr:aldehyde dehydrogenase family protein [Roseovarius sp.]